MSKQFPSLSSDHSEFIAQQHMFFVGTAVAEGSVNLSPKGMDSLRVISDSQIAWLNLTGSGNETAAHVRENPRMTLMFCSFDKAPLILRVYGTARALHTDDADWQDWADKFPNYNGARQIFVVDIAMVQTSCGFAVPYYDFAGERPTLDTWAEKQSREDIEAYWQKKNTKTIDGFDTGIAK